MILPGRHLPADMALLTIGARVLAQLDRPRHVSALWDRVRAADSERPTARRLSFDQFTLALSLLYAVGAVENGGGVIRPGRQAPSGTVAVS